MRASLRLLKNTHKITLFTRAGCGLCDTAKEVLHRVQAQTPFQYHEVDIASKNQSRWYDAYAFDVPVIHVEKADAPGDATVPTGQKLMHRFTEQQVQALMDRVTPLQ